jgi:hypothetical protein
LSETLETISVGTHFRGKLSFFSEWVRVREFLDAASTTAARRGL